MIPLILKLRIKDKNHKGFGIWLPLFLLWLIVLPIACDSCSNSISGCALFSGRVVMDGSYFILISQYFTIISEYVGTKVLISSQKTALFIWI